MSRSAWKNVVYYPSRSEGTYEKMFGRGYRLPSTLVSSRIYVHTGKVFGTLKIKAGHCQTYLGSFFLTKKMGSVIHSVSKKRSKQKLKKK